MGDNQGWFLSGTEVRGLDLTPYLGKSVQVEIYRLNEALPVGSGQNVEIPYDRKIYWTAFGDNTMPKEMDNISIKVGILDENEKLIAEKEVKILYNGFYTVQASPDVIIGVKGR